MILFSFPYTDMLYERALGLLRQAVNDPHANFHAGQWEAIEALVRHRARLLVVQRTGWGKSLVYFIATKLLRDAGAGPTLLVSPLLALMRDQQAAAARLGVVADSINSTNPNDWRAVSQRVLGGAVDVLLISPERLANQEFREKTLLPIADAVGLFVVDEAHCISDWGHDFRPDYRRITRILQALPRGVASLATTATANTRVVEDIQGQLGPNLVVQRGPLARPSLRLQNISLPSQAARMAWLAEHVPALPGSGIIYTLTVRDARMLADWLQSRGVDAHAYYGDLDDAQRRVLEQDLLQNRIKALVSTPALGMGFD
ncbi:MAG TPA: DEAD/DEAH box helicase, partial [Longimicrobium sp.]|nr:DEAD/DEAH box helicase [Longimicrobium sp.]